MSTSTFGPGITTKSMFNTPQAVDDLGYVTEGGPSISYFDVMGNDLGGNAKQLWAIAAGSESQVVANNGDANVTTGEAMWSDLITKDAQGVVSEGGLTGYTDTTALGAKVAIVNGQIAYDTSAISALINSLGQGQQLTDTITYTIRLGNGTLSLATLTVTLTGTNDVPVASAAVHAVLEDASISGSVSATDADAGQTATLSYALVGAAPAGLSFNANGSYSFDAASYDSLAAGATLVLTIPFTASDATSTSAAADLVITLTGTNDAALLSSAVVALAETDAALTTGGTLTISDIDNPATFVAQTGTVGSIGTFSIDTAGAWSFTANSAFDSLNVGNSVSNTFSVAAADGTLTSVQVTINGTNDAAILSSAVVPLDETNAALTTGGTLTISDVDNPATFVAQTNTVGTIGTFSITTAGVWSFTANSAFDNLNVGGSVSSTFSVAAADGTLTSVQVTINGTPDGTAIPAVVTGADPNDFDVQATGAAGGILLEGNTQDNTLRGGSGNDTIDAKNGADLVYGGAGADSIFGDSGTDLIYGGSGNDTIGGGQDIDAIYGGSGNDMITGNAGNDNIYGGYGADTMTGDSGVDTFIFLSTNDTGDTITDFASGADKINLAAIDANNNSIATNEAFVFGGTTATANGVWYEVSGVNRTVYLDTNGNTSDAELVFTLTGTTALVATDFIL